MKKISKIKTNKPEQNKPKKKKKNKKRNQGKSSRHIYRHRDTQIYTHKNPVKSQK